MTTIQTLEDVVNDLLSQPVDDADALREVLGGHDPAAVAGALLDRLEGPEPTYDERAVTSLLFSLDETKPLLPRLESLALDTTKHRLARATALSLLAETPDAEPLFAKLSPEDATLPVEASIDELVGFAVDHEEASKELASLIADAPSTARPFLIQTLVRVCEAQGVPSEVLVAPLLKKKPLAAQHEMVVEILAQDAGARGAELLEKMGKRSGEPFATAAKRIRERLAATPIPEGTEAWVLPADGAGGFQVLIATAGPRRTLVGALGHVDTGLRDGLFHADLEQHELEALVQSVYDTENLPIAPVPVAKAAALLLHFARKTKELPWSLSPVLALTGHFEKEDYVQPQAAASIDAGKLTALLNESHFRSWLFELDELPSQPPDAGPAREAWIVKAAPEVEKPAQARLAAMARFNAWWHASQGQAEEAALLAAAALELEQTPERSALLRHVVESTAQALDELLAMEAEGRFDDDEA